MDGAWLSQVVAASGVQVVRVEGFTSIEPLPPRREAIDPTTQLKRKDVSWRRTRGENKAKIEAMIQALDASPQE